MTQQDYQMALSDAIAVLVEKSYLDKSYLPAQVTSIEEDILAFKLLITAQEVKR